MGKREFKRYIFFEYIKKRFEANVDFGRINIDKDIKNIDNKEFKNMAKESISILKKTTKNIKNSTKIDLGLNLNNKSVEKELKKLYSLQKSKKYAFYHLELFNHIQKVVKNIQVVQINLSYPPINLISKNK